MFGDAARETIGGMPELLVRIDWVDDLPDGTVQDAARTQESIAFAGWIEFADCDPSPDRRSEHSGNEDRDAP